MKTHTFDKLCTGMVYDETQCSDDIAPGDVLVVPGEKVVGFLLQAWPVAVTKNRGKFHLPSVTLAKLAANYAAQKDYTASIAKAVEIAKGMGLETVE